MKRNSSISSMFQSHEAAKAKRIASSSSPAEGVAGHTNEQVDNVVAAVVVNPTPPLLESKNGGAEHGQEEEPEEHTQEQNDSLVTAIVVNPTPSFQHQNTNTTTSMPRSSNANEDNVYNVELLPHDPGKRIPIASYPVNVQDEVRRGYILKGRFRPSKHDYLVREIKCRNRHFSSDWYDKYPWIEYSVKEDAAFCFVCYLFKVKSKGGNSFVEGGWRNWDKCERLTTHVGGIKSIHNQAQEKFNFFVNPETSVSKVIIKISEADRNLYIARLTCSIRSLTFILRQGLAFRGHDESEHSCNKGNFLELLAWLAANNEDINKIVLNNAPRNCKLTCHRIQKEIINCCAMEVSKHIIEEIGDGHFAILADESSDVSHKEQLALCLRYVHKLGWVCERFLGVIHVADTTSVSLKTAIELLLDAHHLTLSQVRGQGYDGASNMKGEIKGLKTLIMNESPCAYYIHCFAHQLQLVLVAVAKANSGPVWFFDQVSQLLNIIGVSCKRHDMLRNVRAQEILKALEDGEAQSGRGLNQTMGLARPAETRWGSHYKTIVHIITMYSTIRKVLVKIGKYPAHKNDWLKVHTIVGGFESYEFVFNAHLMLVILGYTDELSQCLQKRDQDIINTMSLVDLAKERMQHMRDLGWDGFQETVSSFCTKNGIKVPLPDARYVPHGRSRRFYAKQTIDDHYRREVYLGVIDIIQQELANRFDEVNMDLLRCMSALNPLDSFASYDREKVLQLAQFYPNDFSQADLIRLPFQLDTFIADMRSDDRFKNLKNLVELSIKLVETKKDCLYKLVYLLLKLVLILPVATANVERVFSAMKLVKNKLRNSMGGQLLNDCLVTFIERDIFWKVTDDDVVQHFMAQRTRKVE